MMFVHWEKGLENIWEYLINQNIIRTQDNVSIGWTSKKKKKIQLLCFPFPLCLSCVIRFGKKKDDKKVSKAAQSKLKSEMLSDHEFERMKEERERWETLNLHHHQWPTLPVVQHTYSLTCSEPVQTGQRSEVADPSSSLISSMVFLLSVRIESAHPELQAQRSRDQQGGGARSTYPNVEDDDADPNYARIQNFRDRDAVSGPQSPPYSSVQHNHGLAASPQTASATAAAFPGHGNYPNNPVAVPDDDQIDRLYAKVNKPRATGPNSPPASAASDR